MHAKLRKQVGCSMSFETWNKHASKAACDASTERQNYLSLSGALKIEHDANSDFR